MQLHYFFIQIHRKIGSATLIPLAFARFAPRDHQIMITVYLFVEIRNCFHVIYVIYKSLGA